MLRRLILFLLISIVLLMNGCGLIMYERRDTKISGWLAADVILFNPGAMSDYSGSVWVYPKIVPRIWPLDGIVGCQALHFESDPGIQVSWQGSVLTVEHDRFVSQVTKRNKCYGRLITFRERPDQR